MPKLTGIAAEVTKPMVGVLLAERPPDILERVYEGSPQTPMFDVFVQMIAAQVVAVVGSDVRGDRRALAIQCIAYGVGSEVEYAEFPEQQLAGGTGRGWFLKQRFAELLETLRGMPADGNGGGAAGISRARSPKPRRYPDPIRHG